MKDLIVVNKEDYALMRSQAEDYIKSGLLPRALNTPEKVMLVAMKGHELGIPMLQACAHIHVIDGKPSMDSELMMGQIYKNIPTAEVEFLESTDKGCKLRARRNKDRVWSEFSFTFKDATTARLLAKNNWRNYPTAMYRARSISAMARAVFPDAIAGMGYTPEELGAETDSKGNVVEGSKAERIGDLLSGKSEPKEVESEVVQTTSVPSPDNEQPETVDTPTDTKETLAKELLAAWSAVYPDKKVTELRGWIKKETGKIFELLEVDEIKALIYGLKKG